MSQTTEADRRRWLIMKSDVRSALGHLAWPLAVRFQVTILLGMVPAFWMGRIIGTVGLSLATVITPLEQICVNIFLAFTIGSGSLLAKAVGAGDREQATRLVVSSSRLVLVLGGIMTAIGLIELDHLVVLLAGRVDIQAPLRVYLVPFLLGVPMLGLTFAGLATFTATGWTTFGMIRLIADFGFSVAVTPLFMIVFGMGFAGPPAAVGLAMLILNVAIEFTIRRRGYEMGLTKERRPSPWLDLRMWWKMLVVGGPVQLGRVSQFVANLALIRLVSSDGRVVSAGFGISYRFVYMASSLMWALARANSIIVGQTLGAGLNERAAEVFRAAVRLIALLAVTLMGLSLVARPAISLFTHDPKVIEASMASLRIMRWSFLGIGATHLLADTYLATGISRLAGLIMVGSSVVSVLVALVLGGSGYERASWGFCAQCTVQAILLATLVKRAFYDPLKMRRSAVTAAAAAQR